MMMNNPWFIFASGFAMGALLTSILYTISNGKLRRQIENIRSLIGPTKPTLTKGIPVKPRRCGKHH